MSVVVTNPALPSVEFLANVGEGVAQVTDGPKVAVTTPPAPPPAPAPAPAPAAPAPAPAPTPASPSVTVNVPNT